MPIPPIHIQGGPKTCESLKPKLLPIQVTNNQVVDERKDKKNQLYATSSLTPAYSTDSNPLAVSILNLFLL